MGERPGELVAAVDEVKRFDLAVGQLGRCGSVIGVRIDAVGRSQSRPRIGRAHTVGDVEERTRRHVVVDDSVFQAVQLVTLPNEFGTNRVGLCRSNPFRQWLFLDSDQLRCEHQ